MPIRPGDTLDLEVTTLAYGGQGIARHEGFVIFVRGAVPGDLVRARVTRRKRGYGEARLLEIVTPSRRRVPARCPHADVCGGCEWQTLEYSAQLEFKQQQVVESLAHIGHLDDYELEPIRGMESPWRYRNKMEFSFSSDDDGHLVLGLHKRGSWQEIVETAGCLLASERLVAARAAVAESCRELGLSAYDRCAGGDGLLRHLTIREGHHSGDLLLNLFVSRRFSAEADLVARVRERCSCTSFALTVNDTPSDAAVGEGPFMLFGPPHFRERLAGVELRVPALAFLQTNTQMCDVLYERALAFAAADRERPAADLYCGIGSMSLALAADAAHVCGVEIQAEAIDAAIVNAQLNDIGNVSFYAGDVRPLLKFAPHPILDAARSDERQRPAAVIVDPPRAGMARRALQRAAALGGDRFVYVSCNPTTLAGNGAELTQLGYRLSRVAPVDMFPQTHHIETVALFERVS